MINWTEGLSLFWGATMIITAMSIIVSPELRKQALKIFSNDNIRYSAIAISVITAIIHLIVYPNVEQSNNLLLLLIGYVAAIKAVILLFVPEFLIGLEDVIISEYMSGWIIVALIMGMYLLNQALHFITL